MSVRQIVQLIISREAETAATLHEYKDWRVVGFHVTQGALGGYPTTAWILLSDADDELEAKLTMSLLDRLVNGPALTVTFHGVVIQSDPFVPHGHMYQVNVEGDNDGGIPE